MTKEVYAILLDTRSIQKYIFASNRLRTNVGASYLVSQIFENEDYGMVGVLKKSGLKMPDEAWNSAKKIAMEEPDTDIQCEIAYIGGGNMIILINPETVSDGEKQCYALVKIWSKNLLKEAPGLKTGCAIGKIILGEEELFKKSIGELYKKLKTNQNNIFPNVDLPYTGLTVECKLSNKSADCQYTYWNGEKNVTEYVASSERAKDEAYKSADQKLKLDLLENLQNKKDFKDFDDDYFSNNFCFTDSIEELGQKDGDEYIAVIHIDGNDMGAKFNNCPTMDHRKRLSDKVAKATRKAFAELVASIVKEYDFYSANDPSKISDFLESKKIREQKVLPIRPIIIGGDDITFVCPAKCGLIYAKRFMEFLRDEKLPLYGKDTENLDNAAGAGKKSKNVKKTKKEKTPQVPFYSCGGIAIVPTKYPFFRAYELAEQLCGEAKKQARSKKENHENGFEDGSSWLDFLVLHGEQSADLERIRQEEFIGDQGNMHYGPYLVDKITREKSVERLIDGALEFVYGSGKYQRPGDALDNYIPKNKIKGLRDVLSKDKGEIALFMQQINRNGIHFPTAQGTLGQFSETLWNQEVSDNEGKNATPYLDMIEIMDFIYGERKEASK